MKSKILFLFLLVFKAQAVDDPLLAVVIMVKNEAEVIVKTVQPFVEGGVKHFLIFDTGSTDGTQEIARTYFKKEGLTHAHVVEEPFIDFATSRNHALTTAETLFPEVTFMIMPDAEWYMQGTQNLLAFCAQEKNTQHPCYYMQMQSGTISFVVARLIRTNAHVRFLGPVHEVLERVPTITVPTASYFTYQPCTQGKEKSAQRWHRDKALLLKEHERDPHSPRTLFYLAQTYECLGDWENAYAYYKKRANVLGWNEENFITHLRLGDVALKLFPCEKPETLPLPQTEVAIQEHIKQFLARKALCPVAIGHYLEAYALRPERAEPLIRIARYYLDLGQMPLAFLFAVQAARIPYPEKDLLFVEKENYDFARYDILGICAWYVGEYELGECAVRKALEVMPNAPHLLGNLKLYVDRKNSLN